MTEAEAFRTLRRSLESATRHLSDLDALLGKMEAEDHRIRALNAELLAACEAIDEIERRGHAFSGEWREAMSLVRAAIAKAKGGG